MTTMRLFLSAILSLGVLRVAAAKYNEFVMLEEHTVQNDYSSPLPHTYVDPDDLPAAFSWADVDGKSYVTRSLNQHIPQYCGSCWAHGALSALADRIKIARNASGDEINLSIQYILNCAGNMAGSCHGGSHTGVYEFIKNKGFVPYDTCQPYLACSSESKDGFCSKVDTTCTAANTCRTCTHGGDCQEIDVFPNATVAEYGSYGILSGHEAIMAEIITRGPVAAGVNAEPLLDYQGGVHKECHFWQSMVNHIVSIVGWGTDDDGDLFWIVRNSWGQYWGELGYFRLAAGKNCLGIESTVAWATPGEFTIHNTPCNEDGSNCQSKIKSQKYIDPSQSGSATTRRLRQG